MRQNLVWSIRRFGGSFKCQMQITFSHSLPYLRNSIFVGWILEPNKFVIFNFQPLRYQRNIYRSVYRGPTHFANGGSCHFQTLFPSQLIQGYLFQHQFLADGHRNIMGLLYQLGRVLRNNGDAYKRQDYNCIYMSQKNEYTFRRSLVKCGEHFLNPACAEQVAFFSIDSIIWLLATYVLINRIRNAPKRCKIPKIKLLIAIFVWCAASFQLVFMIDFNLRWTFYSQILCGYLYFILVVYYFSKKALKVSDRIELLKYSKLIAALFICLYLAYYIYYIYHQAVRIDDLCYQKWYTYSRILALCLDLCLCTVGYVINRRLTARLADSVNNLEQRTQAAIIERNKRSIRTLFWLITVFMVSEAVLLIQAVIFEIYPQLHCQFYSSEPWANFFATFPVLVFGIYLPRISTLYVFRPRSPVATPTLEGEYADTNRTRDLSFNKTIQLEIRRMETRASKQFDLDSPLR